MVLIDENGKPKVFQHEASYFKKGKMMDYETLHAFVTECLVNEYRAKKYEVVNFLLMEDASCDFKIKMPSGKTVCSKIVLTEESFPEVISKTDFSLLFDYCRKEKAYPRLFTVSAWCFATPEGSKMVNGSSFAFKVDSISLLDKDDEPNEHIFSDEALIKGFADAWNNRDTTPLNNILSNHVHYSSSFVFDEIRGKIETVAYLGGIFKRITAANGKSKLTLCRNLETRELMLADLAKDGVFSFQFNDSRISDIRLRPLERSQVEYIAFSEEHEKEAEESQPGQDEVTAGVEGTKIDEPVIVPVDETPTEVEAPAVIADNSTLDKGNAPVDKSRVIENKPIETKPIAATPVPIQVKTPEPMASPTKPAVPSEPIETKIAQPTVAQVDKNRGIPNKWWIIGLSYVLALVLSIVGSILYMKGEVEWSKEEIQSQVNILKTNKHIACLIDENGAPRYKKEESVPSGEFYERHKSFYSTEKKSSWYYRAVEQISPTAFIYSEMVPHGVGFTTPNGTNIAQRFNELKSDIRGDIASTSSISDNNRYLINSMLNANSKYHLIKRTKDNSKSSDWKFESDNGSYGLYYWEDRWNCVVAQNDDAIMKDKMLYSGIIFLIVALIMTIVFMAIPAFRSHAK